MGTKKSLRIGLDEWMFNMISFISERDGMAKTEVVKRAIETKYAKEVGVFQKSAGVSERELLRKYVGEAAEDAGKGMPFTEEEMRKMGEDFDDVDFDDVDLEDL